MSSKSNQGSPFPNAAGVIFDPEIGHDTPNPFLRPNFSEVMSTPDIWWEKHQAGLRIFFAILLTLCAYLLHMYTHIWTGVVLIGWLFFTTLFKSAIKESVLARRTRRMKVFFGENIELWDKVTTPDIWWERYKKVLEILYGLIWLSIASLLYDWVTVHPDDAVGCIYGMVMISLVLRWFYRWYSDIVCIRKALRLHHL